jgi:Zn-dependent protease
MTPTFRLGRVAGIEVGANWSWLLVVALIVWSLAAGVFPDSNPGLSDGTYLAMALVAALLFFLSLFLHELGHALQAQRDGVEIDGITLWVFGGVARFRGDIPSAGAELRIAAAGPAVSLVIGAVCLGLAILVPLPSAVDGVLHWLGYINLVLLAFNLIPAFPLDGGRILRALLWRATGDRRAATRFAAAAGQGFGILLIVTGFFVAAFGGAFGGLWLAFVGFFLLSAAEAEVNMAEAHMALTGVRVADVMVAKPVTVDADTSLQRFIDEIFFAHRHTAYPVVADGETVGLISFRDALPVPREEWQRVRVRERTRRRDELLVVDAARDLADVVPDLARHELHRALVLVGGRATGLLSMTDVARVLEVLTVGRAATTLAAERQERFTRAGRPAIPRP